MQRLSRRRKAGLGWLISAVVHALLLGTLATITLAESSSHPALWVDTRLSREDVPSQVFTLVDNNKPIPDPPNEPSPNVAQSAAASDLVLQPVSMESGSFLSATLSSPFPDDPAELSQPVRLTNTDASSPKTAEGSNVGAQQRAGAGGQSAGFFGVEAEGSRFVYIVDASGSMRGDRFQRACAELVRSISELSSHQGFYVFFFNSVTYPLFYPAAAPSLVPATDENKRRLVQWISQARADGDTYPKTALFTALAMRPDVIFVLSDGKFPERTVRRVTERNESKVVIHSIGFGKRAAEEVLQSLAQQNGGHYRFVP